MKFYGIIVALFCFILSGADFPLTKTVWLAKPRHLLSCSLHDVCLPLRWEEIFIAYFTKCEFGINTKLDGIFITQSFLSLGTDGPNQAR